MQIKVLGSYFVATGFVFVVTAAVAQSRRVDRDTQRRAPVPQRVAAADAGTEVRAPVDCDACRMVPDAPLQDPSLSRIAMCVRPRANGTENPPSFADGFGGLVPRRRMPPARPWQACAENCCQSERIAIDVTSVGFIDRGPTRQIYVDASVSAPSNATPSSIVPQGSVKFFYTCSLVQQDHDYCAALSSHVTAFLQPGHAVISVFRGDGPNSIVVESQRSMMFVGQVTDRIGASVYTALPNLPRLRTDIGPMVVERPVVIAPDPPPGPMSAPQK